MKSICVFCGSSAGNSPSYQAAAKAMAAELVHKGIGLIYGGAKVGLMGILADAVLEKGGEVTGVIVSSLARKEIAHDKLSRLYVTETMHERKQKMYELSDGFIALPGGLGTLDEFFEILTWSVLGYHKKPCGILNTQNYFRSLLEFLDHATREALIKPKHRSLIHVEETPAKLLETFQKAAAPASL